MALPYSTGSALQSKYSGIFKSSAGNYYFVRYSAADSDIQFYKTSDPTVNWAGWSLAASSDTSAIGAPLDFAVRQVGDVLHIAALCGSSVATMVLTYRTFSMATDTVGINETVRTSFDGGVSTTTYKVALVVRSTDSQPVILFQGPKLSVMGTAYSHVYYTRRTGTNTWSANVQVDDNATANFDSPAVVEGGSGRLHFVWVRQTATIATYHRTLTSANALQTQGTVVSGEGELERNVLAYDVSGTMKIVVLSNNGSGTIKAIRFDTADSPSFTAGTGFTGAGAQPFRSFVDGTDVYAVYRGSTDNDIYIRKSTDHGATFGTATSIYTTTILGTDIALSTDFYAPIIQGGYYVYAYWHAVTSNANYNQYNIRTAADTVDDLLAVDPASLSEVTKPVIGQKHNITANDDASLSEVTKPAVHQTHNLTAVDPASASEVTKPVIHLVTPLTAVDAASLSEVTKPAVHQKHALTAVDPASLTEVTKPVLRQVQALTAVDPASLSEVTKPTIHQKHVLDAGNVESASEVTKPAAVIRRNLSAENVESASEVTKPTIHQRHALDATNVESNSELTQPAVHQRHALTAENVESTSELTKPVLVHVIGDTSDDLTAENVESSSELTKPQIAQKHALDAVNPASLSEVTKPAIHQRNVLDATNPASLSEVTKPAVHQRHALDATNVESATEVTKPAAVIRRNLTATDTASSSEVTKPALHQKHALDAQNVESASELTPPDLVDVAPGADPLSAEDVQSASEVTAPTIHQTHVLSAQDIESGSEVTKPEATSPQPVTERRGGGIRMRPQQGVDREDRYAHQGVLKLIRDTLKTGKKRKPSAAQLTHAAEVILQYPALDEIDFTELSRAVGHMVADIGIQPSRTMLVGRILQLAYEAQVEEDDEEVLEMLFDQEIDRMFNSDLEGMWT